MTTPSIPRRLGRVAGTLLACAGAAAALAACGSEETTSATGGNSGGSTTSSSDKGKYTIGLSSALDCTNAVVCAHQKGFEAAVKARGQNAVVLEAAVADLVNNQIKNTDQLRARGVDALAIWPQDAKALQAPIRRAIDAGIPVFTMELYGTEIDGVVSSFFEGRSWQAREAADEVCAKAPDGGGTVLYSNFALPSPALGVLKENFADQIKSCDKGPIKVREFINKTDDVTGARPSAEAALQQTDDAFAVYGYNDPNGIGAALAAERLGKRDDLFITGYNLGDDGVQGLKRGQLDVSWDFRAAMMGQLMADTMVDYVSGKKKDPAKVTTVWAKCYTKATLGDLKSIDDLVKEIGAGKKLADEEPGAYDTSDALLTEPTKPAAGC